MSRTRVRFAIPELDAGGPDRVFFELIQRLPRDEFEVSLAVGRAGGRYFEQLPPDVRVQVLGGGRYPAWRLRTALNDDPPDVLFATLRMTLTAALARAALPGRMRLVSRLANQFSENFAELKGRSLVKHRIAERLAAWSLEAADLVVCQSEMMARDLRSALRSPPPLRVIGNPVEVDEVRRRAEETSAPLPGSPALLAVGRLAPQKGFDVLIQAMPAIRRRWPGATLTILGDGEGRERLSALIAELDLRDGVHLPGFSPNPYPAIRAADLLVSASRYEGFANVLLEAMALGRPVVATACPGATRELVIEGQTGWLAPVDDAAGLAEAVLRALDADRHEVTTRAEGLVRDRYAPERIVAAYAECLRAPAEVPNHPPSCSEDQRSC